MVMGLPWPRLKKPASAARAASRVALLLLLVVVALNAGRRALLDTSDPYKCAALLNDGHWLDSPDRNPERRPFHNWHPPHCLLHDYQRHDISNCNDEDGEMLFIGDSTIRQVFWAAARKLDSIWVSDRRAERDTHDDLQLDVQGARLRFMWDPWLNSTGLREEMKAFMERNTRNGKDKIRGDGKKRSVLLLLGGGLWHARHLQDGYLAPYKLAVDQAAAATSATRSNFGVQNLGFSGIDGVGDQLLFAPVFEPLYDQLSPSREATITPAKIQAMNDHLRYQSQHGLNVPWAFQNMTAGWPEIVGLSGMHVTNTVAAKMADVVLNFRCNARLARREGFPYSQTCCSAYGYANLVQIITAVLGAAILTLAALKRFSPKIANKFSNSTMLDALAMLALAIAYCFIADRTHILEKFPKEFANIDFRVMLGAVVVACLLNIKSIVPSPTSPGHQANGPVKGVRRAKFLPREQSDEFKGWMQIYMLVYGYTGAKSEIDFYKVFRIFFALYLLLSGYGHTKYFLRKRDYSLWRVVSVLARFNTLPVLLSLTMGRPYTSYFFAPLVSFWFLVVYATLRLGYQWNGLWWVLVGKIAAAAFLVTSFVELEGLLEGCTVIIGKVFRADMDAGEWRFYLSNDRWVIFVGMLVAAMHTQTQPRAGAPRPNRWLMIFSQVLLPVLALVAIPAFWIPTSSLRTPDDFDWWFSCIDWVPAVSFVVLRNATPFMRNHYSESFAKIGRMSLELYLLSQHTWLAGDGEGLLRAGFPGGDGTFLGDRWRDVVVLSVVLGWLAWEVRGATQVTAAWLLGNEQAGGGRGTVQQRREVLELPAWGGAGPVSGEGPRDGGVVVAGMKVPRGGLRVLGTCVVVWVASVMSG